MGVQKLEKKTYTRKYIAELMELSPSDKNFKRKVKTRLRNWGYGYNYSCHSVKITSVPLTPIAKLKELLIRKLGFDIQTDFEGFSVMLYLLNTDYDFRTAPWGTRHKMLDKEYGADIGESTMRNWTSKLVREDVLAHSSEYEVWRTTHDCFGSKRQERISADDEEGMKAYENYKAARTAFLKEADENYRKENGGKGQAPDRWKYAFHRLWSEYKCCYYNVKPFLFNAFYDDDYREIFYLVEEVVQNIKVKPTAEKAV